MSGYTTLPHPPTYYMNLKQGSEEWKERRKDFPVTGSQIAAVFNLSAYGNNPKKLYNQKTTNTEEKFSDFQVKRIFAHGTESEPKAAEEFTRWYFETFPELDESVVECGINTYRSESKGYYFGASPDRLIINNSNAEITGIVEIKCPYKKILHWNGFSGYLGFLRMNGGTPTTLTPTCNIRIYSEYYLQMQMQMRSTNVKMGYFAGWTPKEFIIIEVPFSQELWNEVEKGLNQFVDALNEHDTKKLMDKNKSKEFEQIITKLQDEGNKLVYYKYIR